jgi:galactan endo-1,6-beta-galactosidase
MARNLHRDLAMLKPTSWSYWQPIDGGGWGLISGDMVRGRLRRVNPKWHVLAHYTRNIIPGATILTTGDEAVVAAFDEKRGRLVIVCLNDGDTEREWGIDLSHFKATSLTATGWITEPRGATRYQALESIAIEGNQVSLRLPKRSVQTVVVSGLSGS